MADWQYQELRQIYDALFEEHNRVLADRASLRTALTARDELLAKAGEDAAWDWIESQYLDADKGYHPNDRAYSSDEMVDAFMAGQDHAASLAAELKEKQG